MVTTEFLFTDENWIQSYKKWVSYFVLEKRGVIWSKSWETKDKSYENIHEKNVSHYLMQNNRMFGFQHDHRTPISIMRHEIIPSTSILVFKLYCTKMFNIPINGLNNRKYKKQLSAI